MIKIAPSILSADFANLAESVKKVGSADLIHVDIMDGHFVPNITIGLPVVNSLKQSTCIPLDVHLMIEKPDRYIQAFAEAGSSIITVHVEASHHLHRTIKAIRDARCLSGVALCPATPVVMIEHVIDMVDLVLIMTVNPGFGGQSFIPEMVPKIKKVKEMIQKTGKDIALEVDGGINDTTAAVAVKAGANVLVSGSHIFKSDVPDEKIQHLRRICASVF
ncbi:MAG: ribulose-phosphate 3-epimerase [Firmicutes bacterium]|nr:ribulose-phosphate 3-epimerase [Bacillota bacterium]